jgi:hypothetical protein
MVFTRNKARAECASFLRFTGCGLAEGEDGHDRRVSEVGLLRFEVNQDGTEKD